MRYMRWSYDQLLACPEPYLDGIADHAAREREEQDEAERRANRV